MAGVRNARLSSGLAGIIGVLVTLLLAGGLFWVLRRRDGLRSGGLTMGGAHGHGHPLYYAAHSPVHRLAGHVKIIALLAFMIIVVATPALWYGAFAGYLVVLIMVVGSPGCLRRYLLPRMVVELPFVVFALLLPFLALGPRTEVLGLTVSAPAWSPPGPCWPRPPWA